jgi:hypothetical protein
MAGSSNKGPSEAYATSEADAPSARSAAVQDM